jgi:hypothetical protein
VGISESDICLLFSLTWLRECRSNLTYLVEVAKLGRMLEGRDTFAHC